MTFYLFACEKMYVNNFNKEGLHNLCPIEFIIVITIVYYIIIIQFKPLVFRLYAHQISRAYLKVKGQI